MKIRAVVSFFAVTLSALFILSCGKSLQTSQSPPASVQPENTFQSSEFFIRDAIGVVRLSGTTYTGQKNIRFFNPDGSIWLEFPVNSEFVENESFRPFAQKPDYSVLVLKCIGEDDHQYKVIVNEALGLRKFIRKSDQLFEFQCWEEHILELFSVEFNETLNPLRQSPSESAPRAQQFFQLLPFSRCEVDPILFL